MVETYYVRCPDCDYGKNYSGEDARSKALAAQGNHACPNCDRGVACAEGRLDMRAHTDENSPVQPRIA